MNPRETSPIRSATVDKTLNVAHITPANGGVANSARRLHQGLAQAGVNSQLFAPKSSADGIYNQPYTNRLLTYADGVSKITQKYLGMAEITNISSLSWSFPGFDIIHLHGADNGWFNFYALRGLARQHVLVWTMHDKHLGTGACGYPEFFDCERWRIGCGHCPKVKQSHRMADLSHWTYTQKKAILDSIDMTVVAPNHWMFDYISENPITRKQNHRHIPYGIDTTVFVPQPPVDVRRALGLPLDKKLLLFVAFKLDDARKGIQYYPSLLQQLKEKQGDNLGLVVVGGNLPDKMLAELNALIPVYSLGRIDDPHKLAQVYAAADLFLITSTIDNFPNVVLESLACGTPAAGFRVGGIPDMILQDQTGILVELGDTVTMAEQIGNLLNDAPRLEQMRLTCREQAIKQFSLNIQASRYIELYQELIHHKQGVTH